MTYLTKHHYLRGDTADVTEALRELQADFGLSVTGNIYYGTHLVVGKVIF